MEGKVSTVKRPKKGGGTAATVAIFAVGVITGGLFAISALTSDGRPEDLEVDLHTVAAARQASILEAEEANRELQARVDKLVEVTDTWDSPSSASSLYDHALVGPGVTVELNDAPADLTVGPEVNVNDLVVHQEDVNAVMNALWQGGAEAMAVQGLRITPRTPVRCIGNVILVGGNVFSPPYRIEAIGNPAGMTAALDDSPQLEIYRQYVRAYGIGWGVEENSELTIPELSEGLSFQNVRVLEEEVE